MNHMQSEAAMRARAERVARVFGDLGKSQSEEKQKQLAIKFNRLMKGAPKNPKNESEKMLSENIRTFAIAKIILDSLSREEKDLVSEEIKKGVDCVSLASALE